MSSDTVIAARPQLTVTAGPVLDVAAVQAGLLHEPRMVLVVVLLTLLVGIPDALFALWLQLLGNAVTAQDSATVWIVLGLMAVSATMTWLLTVVNARLTRRFRDRVTVALETHVATLQASVSGLEHQERSDYLDRLEVLRTQIFVLDHMYASVLNTLGWLVRLTITLALLASIHPGLLLLAVFAVPTVVSSVRRPAADAGSRNAAHRAAGSPSTFSAWPPAQTRARKSE